MAIRRGAEYLDSLRDDRDVYLYGDRVKDVTLHPGFANPARMVARMYDALHDPATQAKLTVATDTGSGGFTHPFYRTPRSVEELAPVCLGLLALRGSSA